MQSSSLFTNSKHPHYQDANIVFQFFLSEFLKAVEEVTSLDERLSLYKQKNNDNYRELFVSLVELCGFLPKHARFFPWGLAEGSLNKLITLIQQYVQLVGDSKELKEIQNILDKCLKEAHKALDLLKDSEKDKTSLYLEEMIAMHLTQTLKTFKKLNKLILPLLQQFKNSENVLFFLLRNLQALRKIYGKRAIVQLFKDIHPNGPQSLERFLLKEYSRRGFSQLAKNINEKMAELTL
ncbi:hypothetical protein PHSC3_001589 [Chlamydiales bacterium STE3]|nr:hypothetical protein PHSC3_001589 [Chlamydiales bacterium STE3]